MKKAVVFVGLGLLIAGISQAAIVTNTNQSAAYIRLLSRNSSTEVDAAYYNPAGLVKLNDGWHLYLSNQMINQTKTIVNDFPLLNNSTYEGKVNVPLFPDFYAVWKKGKLAVSFGFGPNAGGGSADFATGLPSFETNLAMLPLMITSMGLPTTAYSADIIFSGSSIYLGFQGNVSYAVSDMFSLAAGFRYITATNKYEGHLKSVMINPYHPALNPTAAMMPAVTFFNAIGQPAYAAAVADAEVDAEQTAAGFTPIISLHATPIPELNFSLRYEFNTKLEFTNNTTVDGTGLFPDGYKHREDIPAILAIGADYAISPAFRAALSFSLYFDKNADWEGRQDFLDKNGYEIALGLEYDITEMFTVSAGYMLSRYGLTDDFQSDMAHSLEADSFGFGGRIKLSSQLYIDLGALIASYKDYSKQLAYYANPVTPLGIYRELYQRKTVDFSVGINYSFGGGN